MGETANRVGKSIRAVAGAGAEGLTGTADALPGAATEVILPAAVKGAAGVRDAFARPGGTEGS